jgi:TPR repeat protein
MALLKCPECGHKVSSFAKVCPNCGCPIEEVKSQNDVFEDPSNDQTGHLQSALDGDAASQAQYAFCLDHGQNVNVNKQRAAYWAKKSSDQRNDYGMYLYAFMLLRGDTYGITPNPKLAFLLLEYAANDGEANAEYELGMIYLKGFEPVNQIDETVGVYWLSKAEEQNKESATNALSNIENDKVFNSLFLGSDIDLSDNDVLDDAIEEMDPAEDE